MNKAIEFDKRRVATNPTDWYWREDVMQVEREHIFKKYWQLFARMGQFQSVGDYVDDTVAGIPVIVILGEDGELRAFHNVCRHRAGIVAGEAQGNCARLRCIYHGWTYDMYGHLIKAPKIMDEEGFDTGKFSLMPVRCESWNGLVFVHFDMAAQSLLDWLGDIVEIMTRFPALDEDYKFIQEDMIEFAANWKAYGDNSCEGYHLPLIHRDMASDIKKQLTTIEAREGGYVNFDITYKDSSSGCWIYRYPNFMLACELNHINVQSIDPVSATASRIRDYFWFDPVCPEESIKEDLDESNLVTREDQNICANVQRNLEAGIYQYGELSPVQEQGTRYFQELIRNDIQDKLD